MTKKKTAPVKKPMKQSLTVQSSLALAVLIIAKTLLPLYTGLEIPDEVFVTLCSLLGVTVSYGMRRAIVPILIIGMPMSLVQCSASICDKAQVRISAHPDGLPAPAGEVKVTCDGKLRASIRAKSVPKVGCDDAAICCEGLSETPVPKEMEE